jgi:hypothetical protein
LRSSQLAIFVDCTKSNLTNGVASFGGRSLHDTSDPSAPNPYQEVISCISDALAPFDGDGEVPVFGFGDATTGDKKVFVCTQRKGGGPLQAGGSAGAAVLGGDAPGGGDLALGEAAAVPGEEGACWSGRGAAGGAAGGARAWRGLEERQRVRGRKQRALWKRFLPGLGPDIADATRPNRIGRRVSPHLLVQFAVHEATDVEAIGEAVLGLPGRIVRDHFDPVAFGVLEGELEPLLDGPAFTGIRPLEDHTTGNAGHRTAGACPRKLHLIERTMRRDTCRLRSPDDVDRPPGQDRESEESHNAEASTGAGMTDRQAHILDEDIHD